MDESWLLCVDWLGRPVLANAVHSMHYRTASKHRKLWRAAGRKSAVDLGIPPCEAIVLTVQARYARKPLCDPDAPAPSLKGILDGLVDAGVIPDDNGQFVHSIEYIAPRLERGSLDALLVKVARSDRSQLTLDL